MTAFISSIDLGAKAWVFNGERVRDLTVGRVSLIATKSAGTDCFEGSIVCNDGDNYAAMEEFKEDYMCTETGIGSGQVYTYGVHIFKTKEECEAASVEQIEAKMINESLLEALISMRDDVKKPTCGICDNVWVGPDRLCTVTYDVLLRGLWKLDGLFAKWPHFSGDQMFPVPPGYYHNEMTAAVSARQIFMSTHDMWDKSSVYGTLRWDLLNFCIDELSNELA